MESRNCSENDLRMLALKYKLLRRPKQERHVLKCRLEAKLDEIEARERRLAEVVERASKLQERLGKSKELLERNKLLRARKEQELEERQSRLRTAKARHCAQGTELLEKYREFEALKNTSVLVSSELLKLRQAQVKILSRIFPLSQGKSRHVRICEVPLPLKDDVSSVKPVELSASLGFMNHLVCSAAQCLSAPLLYQGASALSSSRIWQRASYWNSRPSSRSEEYPLFIPQKAEQGVTQGLKLLKANILCLTAIGFKMMSLPVPSNMSTFEAFMELMSIMKSGKSKSSSTKHGTTLLELKDSEASWSYNSHGEGISPESWESIEWGGSWGMQSLE